jgi:hypothetical protein
MNIATASNIRITTTTTINIAATAVVTRGENGMIH